MTTLVLDHLFCFVDREFVGSPDCARLEQFGLNLEFGRRHVGQGTANRLSLFRGAALEFLWLEDRDEAERHPLRLDRRADWRAHGGDPFGLCLRGRLTPSLREHLRFFAIAGFPGGGIWIAPASDDLRAPMVFVMELDTDPRADYPAPLFEHPGGFQKIAAVELCSTIPLASALGPVAAALHPELRLRQATEPRADVELSPTTGTGAGADAPKQLSLGPLRLLVAG